MVEAAIRAVRWIGVENPVLPAFAIVRVVQNLLFGGPNRIPPFRSGEKSEKVIIRVHRIRHWLGKHLSLVEGIALVGLAVIGGAIRAYDIGAKSLWYDEAVVYWISRTDLSSLVAANAQLNSAPPLYVLLVHFASRIGTSEGVIRSVSWLAGALAIPLIYFLGRRYVSRRAAFASAMVVAVTPVYVEYSQQLREYSLAFLLSALMLLAYGKFKEKGSWIHLGFLATTFCVGVLLQYGLALLILSLNLAFLVEVDWLRRNRTELAKWVAGQVVVLMVLALVWASTLRFQLSLGGYGYLARGYFEGSLPSLVTFLLRQTYEIVLFAFPDPPLVILLMATAIVTRITDGSSPRKYAHLVIPFLIAAAAGILGLYPYVGARHAIYLFPIICILIAMGFDYLIRVDRRGIVALLLAILVARAALLPTLGYLRSQGTENLKPLVEQLNADLQPGDRIFVCDGAIPAFRYYYRGDLDQVVEGASTEYWQQQLSSLVDTSGRVWLVASHCGDVSTYVNFASQRRPMEEVGSKDQAWLYLSP